MNNDINDRIKIELEKFINNKINHISKTLDFHNSLQKHVASMAKLFDLKSVVEYKLYKENMYNRYVDVVWMDKNKKVMYAIEIDSSLRIKSLEKLNHIKAENKIWILYCNSINNFYFDYLMNKYNKDGKINIFYLGALRQYLKNKFMGNEKLW
jgi:hypothetical protein